MNIGIDKALAKIMRQNKIIFRDYSLTAETDSSVNRKVLLRYASFDLIKIRNDQRGNLLWTATDRLRGWLPREKKRLEILCAWPSDTPAENIVPSVKLILQRTIRRRCSEGLLGSLDPEGLSEADALLLLAGLGELGWIFPEEKKLPVLGFVTPKTVIEHNLEITGRRDRHLRVKKRLHKMVYTEGVILALKQYLRSPALTPIAAYDLGEFEALQHFEVQRIALAYPRGDGAIAWR